MKYWESSLEHKELTKVTKDRKICFQRNKKGKRHQTIFYCDTYLDKENRDAWRCVLAIALKNIAQNNNIDFNLLNKFSFFIYKDT